MRRLAWAAVLVAFAAAFLYASIARSAPIDAADSRLRVPGRGDKWALLRELTTLVRVLANLPVEPKSPAIPDIPDGPPWGTVTMLGTGYAGLHDPKAAPSGIRSNFRVPAAHFQGWDGIPTGCWERP